MCNVKSCRGALPVFLPNPCEVGGKNCSEDKFLSNTSALLDQPNVALNKPSWAMGGADYGGLPERANDGNT